MKQVVIPIRYVSYKQSLIYHMWEWIMLKWASNQVIMKDKQVQRHAKIANQSSKQTKSPCLKQMRYPLIDQLNTVFFSTSIQAWSSKSSMESPICGPAFFTCAPTRSVWLAFIGEKLVFEKLESPLILFFILKGK